MTLSEFSPEPSVIVNPEDSFHPEVPFEKYVYMAAFRNEELFESIDDYLMFFKNWTETTPAFEVHLCILANKCLIQIELDKKLNHTLFVCAVRPLMLTIPNKLTILSKLTTFATSVY